MYAEGSLLGKWSERVRGGEGGWWKVGIICFSIVMWRCFYNYIEYSVIHSCRGVIHLLLVQCEIINMESF